MQFVGIDLAWGDERCMVIGDTVTGYIVTPITPELRLCVESCVAMPKIGDEGDAALARIDDIHRKAGN